MCKIQWQGNYCDEGDICRPRALFARKWTLCAMMDFATLQITLQMQIC